MDGSAVKNKTSNRNGGIKWEQQFQILNMLLINGAVAMEGGWQKSDNNVSNKGGSGGEHSGCRESTASQGSD